ncbi:MAG: HD domain-containing protein [Planctomycetes bacterium]|nr:HD domain-containing protein [Planctomycetota bacterium]
MQKLALELGGDEGGVRDAGLLGAIHDIGKIHVEAAIFKKLQAGETLQAADRKKLARKPEEIFKIIDEKLLSREVKDAVVHQRCRYDGKGSPPVAGEKIPLLARMLCIVDYYDMLTRQRTGRTPLTEVQVREVLEVNKGKIFDPVLAQAFLSHLDKGR